MVSFLLWSLWLIAYYILATLTLLGSLLIWLYLSISGMLTNFLKAITSQILKINMGRTFRREKTYGPRRPRLNSHRDLPDYQDDILDEEDLFYYDEEFLDGKLHSEEQDVVGSEDEPTRQRD